MRPPSLAELALQQCLKFATNINDVGEARFDLVRPILFRATARQLVTIEENSPQLRPATEEVWEALIEKEFPDRPKPERPYREAYERLSQEKDDLLGAARERLKRKQQQYQKERVASSIVPLAEPVRRAVSGSGTVGYNWRSTKMQQMARQARAQAGVRRPAMQFAATKASIGLRGPIKVANRPLSTPPLPFPSSVPSAVSHGSLPSAAGQLSPAASPPPPSKAVLSPTQAGPERRRRTVSSVFISRR